MKRNACLSSQKKCRLIILGVSSLCMIMLFAYQEKRFIYENRQNLTAHSEVLSDPLWKIDKETVYHYLNLASRTDNYLGVVVYLFPDDEPFIDMRRSILSNFGEFLLELRIYRKVPMEVSVMNDREGIALIKVIILNRNMRLYLLESLILLVLDSLLVRLIIFFKDKRNLEEAVLLTRGKVRESEARFSTLVENIPGISYRSIPDKEWSVLFISDEVEHVTGHSSMEFMKARGISFFSLIAREDKGRVERTIRSAIHSRQPFTTEYSLICRDGLERWVYDRGKGIFDSNGSLKYIDGVILDITEQKKTKDEKEILEHRFNQAQKRETVGRLAGGIAHDFNNLLTPILGFSDLLMEEADKQGLSKDYLKEIIGAAERAKELVQQLLSYSRNQTLSNDSFSINDLIRSFELLLKGTIKENIDLRLDLERDIPPVWADKGQIEQVVMNIVVNARDAMPDGGKMIIKTSSDQTCVSMHISDSGTGMEKEILEHIFEPFYSTKGQKGTGLGLSTVYGIIRQQKGAIDVESRVNEGTVFHIRLPRADKEVPCD